MAMEPSPRQSPTPAEVTAALAKVVEEEAKLNTPETEALLEGEQPSTSGEISEAATKSGDAKRSKNSLIKRVFARVRSSTDSGRGTSGTTSARTSIDQDASPEESEGSSSDSTYKKENGSSSGPSVSYHSGQGSGIASDENSSSAKESISSGAHTNKSSSGSGSVSIPGEQTVVIRTEVKSPLQDIAVLAGQVGQEEPEVAADSSQATLAISSAQTATPGTASSVPPRAVKRQMPTPVHPNPEHWSAYPHTVIKYLAVLCIPVHLIWVFHLAMIAAEVLKVSLHFATGMLALTIIGATTVVFTLIVERQHVRTLRYAALACYVPVQISWSLTLKDLNICFYFGNLVILFTVILIFTEYLCSPKDMLLEWKKYYFDMRHHEIINEPVVAFRREDGAPTTEGTAEVLALGEAQGEAQGEPRPESDDTQASSRGISSIPTSSRATDRGESRNTAILQIETTNNIPEDTDALIPADNPV